MNHFLLLILIPMRVVLAGSLLFACILAEADDRPAPRDPMAPPATARAAAPAADTAAPAAPLAARHLMVVDGRRYVMDAGRRRAVGDLLGSARIERIDDSAVWVRQDGALQRLPLFGDVVRRPVADAASPIARPTPPARPTAPTTTALARPERPALPKFASNPGDPQ